ncbi:MAG: SDR family oxidoreductase [Planctomycetaceae bacterium]|nr:SDR family oxidoreductase [Planctomycetaceae bacterium]
MDLANRWALVTGASSGIGEEFARQLAARGMHLVLTARREERLFALSRQLQQQHGCQVVLLPLDLARPEDVKQLVERVRQLPQPLHLLVNNAGIGNVATLQETNPGRMLEIVDLNIRAVTDLTYALLPDMVRRNEGGVINVASVAAFQPIAYMSVYAASKAFVLHFSEGLWAELQETNVRMLALCPGTTRTEFFEQAGVENWLTRRSAHNVTTVVKAALESFERKRAICVPGWNNWFASLLHRVFRRAVVVSQTKKIFGAHLEPKPERENSTHA